MELLILNTNLEVIHILDSFESLIWKERYCGYGDFEIYARASDELMSILVPDYYVVLKESNVVMVIEDRNVEFDVENGSHIIITGRSLESILDRRIVWSQTALNGAFQDGIEILLNENVIAPTDTDRTIPNFIFKSSTDADIIALDLEAQFTRTNIYESIKKSCDAKNIGFRVILNGDNKFEFELYIGKDRSYDQLVNSYVIFSTDFDNILNGEYKAAKSTSKTLTVVAGEGEGAARITTVVGEGVNLERREMYTDARDLSRTVDGVEILESEYINQLQQRGERDLSERTIDRDLDSEVDTKSKFKYGVDYNLGDIVQIIGDYGVEGSARVTELIRSQNVNGINIYPRFSMIG